MQSGGSLIIFQFCRCKNLALNRVFFPIVLRGRHVLYLVGVWMPPTFVHPYMYVCPLYVHTPPWGIHTPICPPNSSVHLYVLRGFSLLWAVVKGPLYGGYLPYTSPCMGVPPLQFTPPLIHWLPCASVCFGDICMLYGEYFPYVGGWGCSPFVGIFGGITMWGVHMLIFVHSCSSLCLMFLLWL